MEHRRKGDPLPDVKPLVLGQFVDDLVDLLDDPVGAGPLKMFAKIQLEADEHRGAAVVALKNRHADRLALIPCDIII